MNSRQRQGLFMVILAVVLGVLAFAITASHTARVNSQVGEQITVYKLNQDLPAFKQIAPEDVTAVSVPRRWVGSDVYSDDSFVGRKTFVPLSAGSFVNSASLIPAQEIAKGEREIAILVNGESGVAGRINPGDYVNVNVTLDDSSGNTDLRVSTVLIKRARVVSIGGSQTKPQEDGTRSEVVPVTFALSESDSLRLLYAESFGKTVRLSKVPVDDTGSESTPPFTNDDVMKEFGGRS